MLDTLLISTHLYFYKRIKRKIIIYERSNEEKVEVTNKAQSIKENYEWRLSKTQTLVI